jgi:hypothetical protein
MTFDSDFNIPSWTIPLSAIDSSDTHLSAVSFAPLIRSQIGFYTEQQSEITMDTAQVIQPLEDLGLSSDLYQ